MSVEEIVKSFLLEKVVVLQGLDSCCVGYTDTSLIYSYTKLVDYFINLYTNDNCYEDQDEEETYIDAVEWVNHNIVNYKVGGSGQFIIMYDLD